MDHSEFADRHWIALDNTLSRALSSRDVALARERFARRAAAVSDIYLPRIARMMRAAGDGGDLTRELQDLERTHRELTDSLVATWPHR
jgi:hypothetical protein